MEPSRAYFSVSAELIITEGAIPYSIFINSSSLEGRERFVCIARPGEVLSAEDIRRFTAKYRRMYVPEQDRGAFLRSLCRVSGDCAPVEQAKTRILKDSAIHHLKTVFENECSPEVLSKTVVECRDAVEGLIDVLDRYDDIDRLRELIASLSFHDFYTYDHSINVGMYAILIYRQLHPEAGRREIIEAGMAGLLHDLGKIGIPNEILNKAGKLTDDEFREIRGHPRHGSELLQKIRLDGGGEMRMELLSRVILEHHENFDGTGYPCRIAGARIHELSRIVAIADFFDAITTKRSYHEPLSVEDALGLMSKCRGKKIDPALFGTFSAQIESYRPNRELRRELAGDFDPCQPHRELPLVACAAESLGSPKKAFGGISVVAETTDDLKSLARTRGVKVICPKPSSQKKPA